ncbi:TMEM165/GDT1 family protein [Luedemannella helvata]|uniref:GDT1 family protein n=1 Tax=Luedemannella helvata TaxID=349315 RepID=A0ABN2K457_9ACTN
MEALLTAFVLIVPVELPDKTFVATLVLATRYRALPVWLGVVSAFGVQCLVAVAAGGLIALLPPRPVQIVAAVLFAVGAVIMVRGARNADAVEREQEAEFAAKVRGPAAGGLRAFGASFLVLFAAEWGDLSQLLTAGLVARGGHPVGVFLGAWLGLAVVSGAAVLLGRVLLRRVRLSVVRYIGGAVCAILAVVTLIAAFSA